MLFHLPHCGRDLFFEFQRRPVWAIRLWRGSDLAGGQDRLGVFRVLPSSGTHHRSRHDHVTFGNGQLVGFGIGRIVSHAFFREPPVQVGLDGRGFAIFVGDDLFNPRTVHLFGFDLPVHVVEHGQSQLAQKRRRDALAVQGQRDFLSDVAVPFVACLHDRDAHFVEHCCFSGQCLIEFDLGFAFDSPEKSGRV